MPHPKLHVAWLGLPEYPWGYAPFSEAMGEWTIEHAGVRFSPCWNEFQPIFREPTADGKSTVEVPRVETQARSSNAYFLNFHHTRKKAWTGLESKSGKDPQGKVVLVKLTKGQFHLWKLAHPDFDTRVGSHPPPASRQNSKKAKGTKGKRKRKTSEEGEDEDEGDGDGDLYWFQREGSALALGSRSKNACFSSANSSS
ncbi:hypothetical protein FRC03_005568 [Tulasnella sp. 419]|nr:hypothetical protein FRC03_005568 [Tulasnella sp. 419]